MKTLAKLQKVHLVRRSPKQNNGLLKKKKSDNSLSINGKGQNPTKLNRISLASSFNALTEDKILKQSNKKDKGYESHAQTPVKKSSRRRRRRLQKQVLATSAWKIVAIKTKSNGRIGTEDEMAQGSSDGNEYILHNDVHKDPEEEEEEEDSDENLDEKDSEQEEGLDSREERVGSNEDGDSSDENDVGSDHQEEGSSMGEEESNEQMARIGSKGDGEEENSMDESDGTGEEESVAGHDLSVNSEDTGGEEDCGNEDDGVDENVETSGNAGGSSHAKSTMSDVEEIWSKTDGLEHMNTSITADDEDRKRNQESGNMLSGNQTKELNDRKNGRFSVFISNIPYMASEEDVCQHFKDNQSIGRVKLMKDRMTGNSRGRALMRVRDYASYERALSMNGVNMMDRALIVVPDKRMSMEISEGRIQNRTPENRDVIYSVFVSQVPISLSWEKIEQHFLALGYVKRFIFLPVIEDSDNHSQKSMIMEFDDKNVYEKVLQQNGSLVDGYSIQVEPLLERNLKRKRDELETKSPFTKKVKMESSDWRYRFAVFVDLIPLSAGMADLLALFEEAGQVLECRMMEEHHKSNPTFKKAYVRMNNEKAFENALELGKNLTLEGKQLIVKPYKSPSEFTMKKSRYGVFVGNLPHSVTEDDIRMHFKDIGRIEAVRIPLSRENNPKGFAFVEFSDQVSYEKSFSLHGSSLNGRQIKVSSNHDDRNSPAHRPYNTSPTKQDLFKFQTRTRFSAKDNL